MPPANSETPAVELEEIEKELWRQKLKWEQDLDDQREHRLLREGLFYHDDSLNGLSDDDRMWEIIRMSFLQVADVLDSVGLAHYFEYFLQRGILGAKHMRLLTLKYVETKMPRIRDPIERAAIVDAAAECMQNEDMRFFEARYGDIDRLILDCQHARRFLSEKTIHEKWLLDQYDLTSPLHDDTNSFKTKWHVPQKDKDSFYEYDDWVAATGCDGFLFLWPIPESAASIEDAQAATKCSADSRHRVPPVIRCRKLHAAPCIDFAVDWKAMRAITCGLDNKISVYNFSEDNHDEIREKSTEQGFLCIDAKLEDGKAAAGTNFGHIKVLDVENKKFLMSLPGHQDHCKDLRSQKLIHKLVGHNANCSAIDVDFQKRRAASTANEYRFILWEWDLRNFRQLAVCESRGHNANCLVADWAKGRLATGSDDGLVRIWNLNEPKWEPMWEKSIDCMHEMTVAIDADWESNRLVTASWDYNVDMWDLETGDLLHHFVKPRRCMTQAWSPEDGQLHAEAIKSHLGKVKTLLTMGKEVHEVALQQAREAASRLKDTQSKWTASSDAKHKVQSVVDQSQTVKDYAAAGSSQSQLLFVLIVVCVSVLGAMFFNRMRYYEKKHFI
ncbi:unnamed protein product [Symbiodinium pilosum]|uniref:Uncharacterized protein n=1 Tax=Symbiodinium pilosum TaxID=2952 RepID=A0A812VTH2_SYMPI|nr:unnamed protein product [Symbiodinium pilosum]